MHLKLKKDTQKKTNSGGFYLQMVQLMESGQGGDQFGRVFPNGEFVASVEFVDKDEERSILHDDLIRSSH